MKYRFVLWPIWFVLLPLALSLLTVHLLSPGDTFEPRTLLDKLLWAINDQPIPATIGFFTLYEMLLYHYRHALPFAGLSARPGVPPERRRDFEQAAQLLDEADRILRRQRAAIERAVPQSAREELAESLHELRQSLARTPFDVKRFDEAHDRAGKLVAKHLERWQKGELREYVESIGVAIGVALLLRAFVVEAFKIPSGSMLPTLQIQDHIFVNKLAYGPLIPFTSYRILSSTPPERGDVIVFIFPDENPANESQDYIKRAIALPGDTLSLEGGHPIINGWRVPSCKIGDYQSTEGGFSKRAELFVEFLGEHAYVTQYEEGASDGRKGPYHAKAGETWVLGDNRNNSSDSRAWYSGRGGGVPDANIKGRAMFVWAGVPFFDRVFTNVMGVPKPPPGAGPELVQGLEQCLRQRPPLSETTPPAPAGVPHE